MENKYVLCNVGTGQAWVLADYVGSISLPGLRCLPITGPYGCWMVKFADGNSPFLKV